MKLSLNFGDGGIKDWFIQNVEKIVLGVVGVIVILYIWSGTKHKPIDKLKNPDAVATAARGASEHLKKPTWEAIKATRFPIVYDWDQLFSASNIDANAKDYRLNTILDLPIFEIEKPRSKPELVSLKSIHAVGGVGAFEILIQENEGATPVRGQIGSGNRINASNVYVEGARFAAITALIPYSAQLKKFELAFRDAAGYDELRDIPQYYFFDVERAEVLTDGSTGKWVKIGDQQTLEKASLLWPRIQEAICPEQSHPYLTMSMAPLLGEISDKFFVHPEIQRCVVLDQNQSGTTTTPTRTDNTGRPIREPHKPKVQVDPNVQTNEEDKEIEYKLFRFYDVAILYDDPSEASKRGTIDRINAPQAGKSYRYRARLVLDNPNNPHLDRDTGKQLNKPQERNLSKELIQENVTNPTGYWLTTDWSQESEAVYFPIEINVYAGAVNIKREDTRLPLTAEQSVELLSVVWDNEAATRVPGLIAKGFRGQVANMPKNLLTEGVSNIMARDPLSNELVELSTEVESGAILLDIRGGRQISPLKRGSLKAPGEVLLMDKDFNLIVRDATTDFNNFEQFRPAELIEEEEETGDATDFLNQGSKKKGRRRN